MDIVTGIIKLLFGSKADKDRKAIEPYVNKIKEVYPSIAALSNDELRGRSQALMKQIAQFSEIIKLAARDYDPSRINKYVTELAARFHRFYTACRIKGAEEGVLNARLCLADTVRKVIALSLSVIGVSAPEKM